MACCNAVFFTKCAPNGDLVVVIIDPDLGATTYKNEDGTAYTGDPTALTNCSTGEVVVPEWVYVEYDGAVHLEGNPPAGDGTTSDPFQIPVKPCTKTYVAGDVLTYDVTLPDGSTLPAGDPVPDGVIIINEENPFNGSYVEGNAYQADADVCATLAALDPAACTDGPFDLVTADCKTISSDLINHQHVVADCKGPNYTFKTLVSPPPKDPISSMTEVFRDQIGSFIANFDTGTNQPADFVNATFNLPPGTPGCTQIIQVSWGSDRLHLGPTLTETVTGDLGSQTFVGNMDVWGGSLLGGASAVHSDVYAYEVTGAAGATLTLNWPNGNGVNPNGLIDDVATISVVEICGPQFSCWNFGGVVSTEGPETSAADTTTAPAIDFGDCDAVYFGVGRHVLSDQSLVPRETSHDTNWSTFDNTAITEVYDWASYSAFCQIGQTAGLIPGGTGPTIFTGQSNLNTQTKDLDWLALPINCDVGDTITVEESESCSIKIVNPNCDVDARVKAKLTAGGCITAKPGSKLCLQPIINGTIYTQYRLQVDNTNGTEPQSLCQPLQITQFLPAVVSPSGNLTVDVSWQAVDHNGTFSEADGDFISVECPDVAVETIHI